MPGGSRYTWGYVCTKTVLSMGDLCCSCLHFFGMSRWQKCCMIVEIPIFWLKQPVYYFVWICYKKLLMLFVGLMWLDDQEIPNLRAWTKTKWKKKPELSLNDHSCLSCRMPSKSMDHFWWLYHFQQSPTGQRNSGSGCQKWMWLCMWATVLVVR